MFSRATKNIGQLAKSRIPILSCIRHKAAYEGEGKTTVRVINQEYDLGLMIDAYATYGFRLNNGITVLGPMAIFPRTVMSWQVFESEQITEESFSLFKVLEPKIDLILVGLESGADAGAGAGAGAGRARVERTARALGLNVEVLPTEHACATFNFLNAEGRAVAAALIPPFTLSMNDNDKVQSNIHYQDIFNKSLD